MLFIFTVEYSVLKIKHILVIVPLQGHSNEHRYITTYGKNRCVVFYPCFRIIIIRKFIYNSEMHFKILIKEYGEHSIHDSCTGIYKGTGIHKLI